MKHTLKREVLTPLMVIHAGIILLIGTIILRVPSEPVVAIVLLIAAILAVSGTVALWRFVVAELISIKKCHDAIVTGHASEFHSDRDDELGQLEEDITSYSVK